MADLSLEAAIHCGFMWLHRTIGPENDPKIPGRTSTPEDVTTTFRGFLWYAMFEAPEWHPSDQPEQAAEELNVKIQQSFPVTKVFLSMKIVEVKRHLTFELCRFCIVTVTYILDFHQEELEEPSTYINILNAGVKLQRPFLSFALFTAVFLTPRLSDDAFWLDVGDWTDCTNK
jgi:hypothetical protein